MTAVLEGTLVRGPCVVVKLQGPKGNAADELWVVANRLVEV